jgi:2'-5' RNA ligase
MKADRDCGMRTFFALTPGAETALPIESWRMLNWPLLQRPIPAANFHLTLAFLGDISASQLEYLAQRARGTDAGAITLALDTLGYWSKPQILWLGPASCPQALLDLAGKLRKSAASCGLKMDRRAYRPHLSLARRVSPEPTAALTPPRFNCHFNCFGLYESSQGSGGVRYREIEAWPL